MLSYNEEKREYYKLGEYSLYYFENFILPLKKYKTIGEREFKEVIHISIQYDLDKVDEKGNIKLNNPNKIRNAFASAFLKEYTLNQKLEPDLYILNKNLGLKAGKPQFFKLDEKVVSLIKKYVLPMNKYSYIGQKEFEQILCLCDDWAAKVQSQQGEFFAEEETSERSAYSMLLLQEIGNNIREPDLKDLNKRLGLKKTRKKA